MDKSFNIQQRGGLGADMPLLILVLTALLLLSFYSGVFYEGRRAAIKLQTELQDQQRRTALTTSWLRTQSARQQQQSTQTIAQLRNQLDTSQGTVNASHQTYIAAVRSGTVSVRVPVIGVPTCSEPAGSHPAAAPTPGPSKTYAQLDPTAAVDLANIAHDGDTGIRELNYCIDRYAELEQSWQRWQQAISSIEPAYAQTH